MTPVTIVAEAGTAHGGSRDTAFALCKAARDAGADVVKFQHVIADEIVHPATGEVALPSGSVPLHSRFRSLEKDVSFFEAIAEYCDEIGIEFLCSVFGAKSLLDIASLGVRRLKVASPELNHIPLLKNIKRIFLHDQSRSIIISSGVSRLGDIESALGVLGRGAITLLHCVTVYPAPESAYNLAVISPLSLLLGVPVGVSDHSLHPTAVPAVAAAEGAIMIEKHLTLDQGGGGLDDPVALDPGGFARMVEAVRLVEDATDRRAAVVDMLGKDRVTAIRGTGTKQLPEAEAQNYGRTNRSIHAVRDLAAGNRIEASDVVVVRSEKNLRPGLHPEYAEAIVGVKLQRDVRKGDGIVWDDIVDRPFEQKGAPWPAR